MKCGVGDIEIGIIVLTIKAYPEKPMEVI